MKWWGFGQGGCLNFEVWTMLQWSNQTHPKSNRNEEKDWRAETYTGVKLKSIDALPVVQIIGGEVFATSRSLKLTTPFQSSKTIPLNPSDVGHCIASRDQWIFAGGLLTSSPSGVPEYVYIWCPECHTLSLSRIVHSSSFHSDRLHQQNQIALVRYQEWSYCSTEASNLTRPMRYQRWTSKEAAVRMTWGKLVAERMVPLNLMPGPASATPCNASDHHS